MMIELALLGLLTEQAQHGYELKKRLGELLGSWSAISFGSLYPALARLERAGLVQVVDSPADNPGPAGTATAERPGPPVPMTGALSGELAAFRHRLAPKAPRPASPERAARPRGRRGKKVYGISEAGRARFIELLVAPTPDDDRSFALRVAFCGSLPPEDRLVLFERRKAELTAALAARRASGVRRADPYLRSLRERDNRALTHDLAWLDELIAATRTPAPPSAVAQLFPPSPPSLSELGHASRAADA